MPGLRFFTPQHAVHAEHVVVMANLSVLPAIHWRYRVSTNGHIVTFFTICYGHYSSFLSPTIIRKIQQESPQLGH